LAAPAFPFFFKRPMSPGYSPNGQRVKANRNVLFGPSKQTSFQTMR
jgi:hypothetical protein